ncbi:MAG: tetraacyldisaccharide 4'-kinase [candidate division Zixibacteria bacterium]|nr:tetraacyldisaccharide 4'-kinase [candidate division Zixibacteria bacterium]
MWIAKMFRRLCDPNEKVRSLRLLRAALRLPALLYGVGVGARNRAYDAEWLPCRRLPVPVIGVGGLTVGGAGKTPVVRYLSEMLTAQGFCPAILSRGYGRAGRHPMMVTPDTDWRNTGDEPTMLARALADTPVVVGADRYAAGLMAIRACGANVLILDDGFQHRSLHRNADIVAIDTTHWTGNEPLLPAGPLREPLSALRRAHAVMLTRTDQSLSVDAAHETAQRHHPGIPVFETLYRPVRLCRLTDGETLSLDTLTGHPVVALSGIANPRSFETTLTALGAKVVNAARFPDHHPYTRRDMASVRRRAAENRATWIVVTAKDAIRIPRQDATPDILILDIALSVLSDDTELKNFVLSFVLSAIP